MLVYQIISCWSSNLDLPQHTQPGPKVLRKTAWPGRWPIEEKTTWHEYIKLHVFVLLMHTFVYIYLYIPNSTFHTGFGKCHILGIWNIIFNYLLEIISPVFGWCPIRTFTNPCHKIHVSNQTLFVLDMANFCKFVLLCYLLFHGRGVFGNRCSHPQPISTNPGLHSSSSCNNHGNHGSLPFQ